MMKLWLGIAAAVTVIDQLTKYAAEAMLEFHQPVVWLPHFNFTLAYNSGAAFSFLSDQSGWQRWFFVILALGVCALIIHWLRRVGAAEKATGLALALILGGALGNVIDRLMYGHVVDFIDVYYTTAGYCSVLFSPVPAADGMECHWPAFNIADSAISLGAVMMIIASFKSRQEKP